MIHRALHKVGAERHSIDHNVGGFRDRCVDGGIEYGACVVGCIVDGFGCGVCR